MSAGATIQCIDSLFAPEDSDDEKCASIFAAIRPPGHHASCAEAAGFCFFNNVAVAARYAQTHHNVKRICIFDWDVHCGDGTGRTFYEDDSILLISLHRYDKGLFYPGPFGDYKNIGSGAGLGYNVFFGFST